MMLALIVVRIIIYVSKIRNKMKTNLLIFALLGFSLCACEKTDLPAKTMVGEWAWTSSFGGFAPTEFTPQSEGYERSLTISETHYIHVQDGQETLNTEYNFTTEEFEDGTIIEYLEFDGVKALVVELVNSDSLVLWDTCADCFQHTYLRQ